MASQLNSKTVYQCGYSASNQPSPERRPCLRMFLSSCGQIRSVAERFVEDQASPISFRLIMISSLACGAMRAVSSVHHDHHCLPSRGR